MTRPGQLRALILGSSEQSRQLLAEMVADPGLVPILPSDPHAGLEQVRAGVALVVSDMAEPDGSRLLWRVRAIDRDVPILVVPDPSGGPDLLEAEALGVAGILLRPFTHFEFREALDAIIHGGRRILTDPSQIARRGRDRLPGGARGLPPLRKGPPPAGLQGPSRLDAPAPRRATRPRPPLARA